MSKLAGVITTRDSRKTNDVTWSGTSKIIDLDLNKPTISLCINLSADAEVTFHSIVGSIAFEILKADETPLSLTM